MLTNFDASQFLAKHWQKSPCLIRQGISYPLDFADADELAGLALEEEIESRIIQQNKHEWQLLQGPFEPEDFAKLPESHWTLLVQTLDHWLPEINQLVKSFNFIPSWRFDDVMVSYASDQGGVGPHFDNYDVFLVQGQGQRRWQVGAVGDTKAQQTRVNGLLHLADFTPIIDVVMQPGDILYVPPDCPHWGETIGESIGYSVGYRAPQTRDLMALLAEHFDASCESQFFSDSYRDTPNANGQLEPELLNWAKSEIIKVANNQELIESLLSKHLSQSKLEHESDLADAAFNNIASIKTIQLIEGYKLNWIKQGKQLLVSIDGESFTLSCDSLDRVKKLACYQAVEVKGLSDKNQEFAFSPVLANLIERGVITGC